MGRWTHQAGLIDKPPALYLPNIRNAFLSEQYLCSLGRWMGVLMHGACCQGPGLQGGPFRESPQRTMLLGVE